MFPWHTDGPDLNLSDRMVTAIVNVSNSVSCVQIFGFETFVFSRVGEAAIFPGGAMHRSVRVVAQDATSALVEFDPRALAHGNDIVKMVAFYD